MENKNPGGISLCAVFGGIPLSLHYCQNQRSHQKT